MLDADLAFELGVEAPSMRSLKPGAVVLSFSEAGTRRSDYARGFYCVAP